MNIGIIGTGHVGSSLAYALMLKGLGHELVLASRNVTKARGDALDLRHTLAFCDCPMSIASSPIEEVHVCDILVMAASAPLPGELKTRLDLGPVNVNLFNELIPLLARNNPQAIFIIITNPIEVLTYLTYKLSGFSASKVQGEPKRNGIETVHGSIGST